MASKKSKPARPAGSKKKAPTPPAKKGGGGGGGKRRAARSKEEKRLARVYDEMRAVGVYVRNMAREYGHPSDVRGRVNPDGTLDVQVRMYEWPRRDLQDAFLDVSTSMGRAGFETLANGVRVALEFGVSDSHQKAAKYLRLVGGLPTIELKPRVPGNAPGMWAAGRTATRTIGDNDWRVKQVNLHLRYKPEWRSRFVAPGDLARGGARKKGVARGRKKRRK